MKEFIDILYSIPESGDGKEKQLMYYWRHLKRRARRILTTFA